MTFLSFSGIQGIRNFRRQTTKEDRFKPIVDEEFNDADEVEDLDKLRDDLESTKQLLELEVRSKALLEKDNKRMQSELERMRNELMKMQAVATGELFFGFRHLKVNVIACGLFALPDIGISFGSLIDQRFTAGCSAPKARKFRETDKIV